MPLYHNIYINVITNSSRNGKNKSKGVRYMATKEKRNKATICATVSPWLKTKLEQMVDGETFSSVSEIVTLACQEFLFRHFPEYDKVEIKAGMDKSEKPK